MLSFLPISLFDFSFLELPETPSSFQKFLIGIIVISLITLWCFISLVGQILTLYIINYTKLEDKYPKIRRIINYYKNTNYVLIIFDIVFFILTYVIMIGICLYLLYSL